MQAFEELEREWARFCDLDPQGMVCCASGTAALHLALEALQLPPGSEVIVPDYTMIACPRAVALAGLTPVFADCGDDLLMDPDLASAARSKNTSAAVVVHIYGRRSNVGGPAHRDHHPVIEDLAEAHGVKPHARTDAACWSFYRNKIVCGEEGGAVWFRDPKHAALARQLRCLGFTDAHDFSHLPRGHNYRLANCLAERVLESLRHHAHLLAERRRAEALLDGLCPERFKMPPRAAPWVYDIRVPGMTRERQLGLVKAWQELGIQARCGFWPMHLQEEFNGHRQVGGERSEAAGREVVYLPLLGPSDEQYRMAMKLLEEM